MLSSTCCFAREVHASPNIALETKVWRLVGSLREVAVARGLEKQWDSVVGTWISVAGRSKTYKAKRDSDRVEEPERSDAGVASWLRVPPVYPGVMAWMSASAEPRARCDASRR